MEPPEAAAQAGRRLGLTVGTPVPLRSTNNAVVWLAPAPVVAKIGHAERLEFELRVATALSTTAAPTVSPAPEVPTDVHLEAGHAMTFWEHIPDSSEQRVGPTILAEGMAQLHDLLSRVPRDLARRVPAFTKEIELAMTIVDEPEEARLLPANDREILKRAGEHAWATMSRVRPYFMLHGSPHDYNVLTAESGEPVFIDLETVCTGPIEWDLAHQRDAVALAYPHDIDPQVLDDCRFAVSFKTAAFCWADADRGDLRAHAQFHTARVAQSDATQ